MKTEVYVEGARIQLTPAQLSQIEREKKKRARIRGSFEKMLLHFGFKKLDTSDWIRKGILAFEHKYYNWFAEVQERPYGSDVWMVGEGLKSGGFPGGWVYESPQEIEEELSAALDRLSQNA